jgi:hypothetical protein
MGTMQFLSVPYALYAQKSLEPGPEGPKGDTGPQGLQGVQGLKGDQGDPASDDQVLSFDGTNLSISGGNTLNISTLNVPHQLSLLGDTLSIMGGNKVGLTNQIQDLQLDVNNKLKINKNPSATEIDMTRFLDDKQQLSFNSVDNTLAISGGNTIDLTPLIKDDADADPLNEIQDLNLVSNKLTITNKTSPTEINLTPYLDNTDNQSLTYNPATYGLSISGGNSVSLGSMIAFRAKKTISTTELPNTDVTFIPGTVEYNNGNAFNELTGEFVAPLTGIYTFSISYYADGPNSSRKLIIYYNSGVYEDIATDVTQYTLTVRSITMKLNTSDIVKLVINTGSSTQTGTGSFSGFRIY